MDHSTTTTTPPRRHYYSWVPILCSVTWLITLLVLISTWAGQGKPHYISEEGNFPYISDIGADILKPFFIIGCIITALSFVGTLVAERWLRHKGRLTATKKRSQKALAILAIVGAVIGGAGLILLSGFDTKRYTTLHRIFLGVFMLGVALSAIFTVAEYFSLSKHHRANSGLMWSAVSKGLVAALLIAAAIALAICLKTGANHTGAILEWVIAFGFVFYPLTFWIDLHRALPRGKMMQNEQEMGEAR